MTSATEEALENKILDLGARRGSIFDDVQLPAYRPQVNVFRDYSIGRSSPVWNVSDAAKRARRKHHLAMLSQPKKTHPDYLPSKSALPVITRAAMQAVASERLEELAKAISRPTIPENEWSVKQSALNARSSERVLELSRPRPLPTGYQPCKSAGEVWRVSANARKASISDRIEELSKPIIRSVGTNLPRGDAFVVSEAAKKAKATQRIAELAQPIIRGH